MTRIPTIPRTRSAALFALGAALLGLAFAAPAAAQDAKPKAKDDALEGLYKEIKTSRDDKAVPPKADEAKKADAPKARPDETKPKAGAKPAGDKDKAPAKPKGDLSAKDKDLDSFLEKLGETRDKPTADDKSGPGGPPPPGDADKEKDKGPGAGDDQSKDPKKDLPGPATGPKPEPLTGKTKELDEHLQELGGQPRKKDKSKGDASGPMSDVIKQMRDVENRLGKTDTGEETRKEQQQIVKKLETLIEQMKSQSQGQQKKQRQMAMQKGQKPGKEQTGDNPGANPGGAPASKPADPTKKRSLAGGKDSWGHLPPDLRQELENVFKEEFLPSREELIRKYYQAVNKKSLSRGE